ARVASRGEGRELRLVAHAVGPADAPHPPGEHTPGLLSPAKPRPYGSHGSTQCFCATAEGVKWFWRRIAHRAPQLLTGVDGGRREHGPTERSSMPAQSRSSESGTLTSIESKRRNSAPPRMSSSTR